MIGLKNDKLGMLVTKFTPKPIEICHSYDRIEEDPCIS